jgi:hypothetical protein
MHFSRHRGLVALAAWPLGIVLVVALAMLQPATEIPCVDRTETTGGNTSTATCAFAVPSPELSRVALSFLLACGPGVAASAWW